MSSTPSPQTPPPIPRLGIFLRQVKEWPMGKRMWPDEILEVQENIAQVRESLSQHPPWHRPAIELVLRRCQRTVDKSIQFIITEFSQPNINEGGVLPHLSQPLYASTFWMVGRDWVRARQGDEAVLKMAQSMRHEVIREALRFKGADESFIDILSQIRDLSKALQSQASTENHAFVIDWAKQCLSKTYDFDNQEWVLDQILSLGADLEAKDANGKTALLMACEKLDPPRFPSNAVKSIAVVEALLSRGAQWDDFFNDIPPTAQRFIKRSSAWRRAQLQGFVNPNRPPQEDSSSQNQNSSSRTGGAPSLPRI